LCDRREVLKLHVSIYEGDLLTEQVDAIVCATTADMNHTSGLAKAIAKKAGPTVQQDCWSLGRDLKPFQVMHTSSGLLSPNIHHVIHVFAPVDQKLTTDKKVIVSDAFYNCLLYANNTLKVGSVAFPALCTGNTVHHWHLYSSAYIISIISIYHPFSMLARVRWFLH